MNHRVKDNTIRFHIFFLIIIQIIMKNTGFYIKPGQSSMVRTNI